MAENAPSSTTSIPPPPEPKRHITTNNANGKAVFSHLPLSAPGIPHGSLFRLLYQTPRPPASLNQEADIESYQATLSEPQPLLVPEGGASSVWFVDFPPNATAPMHRTVSLDIVVVLEAGSEGLELELDGGEKRALGRGDVVVQRSTMHVWRNLSATDWVRIMVVMAECQEFVDSGGEALGNHPPGSAPRIGGLRPLNV